jgi:hypothetical protein
MNSENTNSQLAELPAHRARALTQRQQDFAALVAAGMKPAQAYRRAYNSQGSSATIAVDSSRLRHMPRMAARILELKANPAARPEAPRPSPPLMSNPENDSVPVMFEPFKPSAFVQSDLGAGLLPGPVSLTYIPLMFDGVEAHDERHRRHIEVHAIFSEALKLRGFPLLPIDSLRSRDREFTYSYSVSSVVAGRWQKNLIIGFGQWSAGRAPWWYCSASLWDCDSPELWPFAGDMLRAVLPHFPVPLVSPDGDASRRELVA